MNKFGLILKRVRQEKNIPLKKAAVLIGKSPSWLSEIENSRGKSSLRDDEYRRIMEIYGGDAYNRQFATWMRLGYWKERSLTDFSEIGTILRYIRIQKKMTLKQASQKSGLSIWSICRIENGTTHTTDEILITFCKAYGYKQESLKNFYREDKAKKSVPIVWKIKSVLKFLSESQSNELWAFIEQNYLDKSASTERKVS